MTMEGSPKRVSGNQQIVEHALDEVRTFIDEVKNGTRKYRRWEVEGVEGWKAWCSSTRSTSTSIPDGNAWRYPAFETRSRGCSSSSPRISRRR